MSQSRAQHLLPDADELFFYLLQKLFVFVLIFSQSIIFTPDHVLICEL